MRGQRSSFTSLSSGSTGESIQLPSYLFNSFSPASRCEINGLSSPAVLSRDGPSLAASRDSFTNYSGSVVVVVVVVAR